MPNPLRRRLRRRWLPQAVTVLLVVVQVQAAEQAAAPQQAPATAPQATPTPAPPGQAQVVPSSQLPVQQSLKIVPLAGNGEMNDLERKVMAPLVVQVLDQNDRAIDGALVVFRFPINGPSAAFPDGRTSVTVRSTSNGEAAAVNWIANSQLGTFQVHINATYGNQVGETTISMTNVPRIEQTSKTSAIITTTGVKHESLWSHRWFKAAVIGAAVAIGVGVYLGTRGGASSGRTVTITPGSPTVSAP